jgi:hypothetical protein
MSFIVRQISRTADGREIIRPKTLDVAQITIGRDPSCDIHLPDLAVTLQHATIRQVTPLRVEIVSTAGIPFDADGRSTERADIDVAKGSTVRMGSHMLTIGRGDESEGDAIVISVERVGAISDASDTKDEQKVFSLAGSAPGKRTMAWAFAGLVLLLALAWPLWSFYANHEGHKGTAREIAFHGDEMWSPGKLSVVHQGLENNCKACHVQPGVAVTDDSCTACHTKVHDHADPRRLAAAMGKPGVGQQIQQGVANTFNHPQGRCVDCHTEHQGATAMPVTAQKFCSDCHTDLSKRLPDTKILNASDFGSPQGHPQFRPAIMTDPGAPMPTVQRLSLDARPLEDNGLKFPHAIHLAANGSVARMGQTLGGRYGFGKALVCANCHVPDASGARFVGITMEKNCQMCHDLAFDEIGGTYRTLKHGDPKQVVADLRAFYRSTGPSRPINVSGMRRRPGDVYAERTAGNYGMAVANYGGRAEGAIQAVFSKGGACFDCHTVSQQGPDDFRIIPVKLPERYMMKGWFDHKAHETEKCESCHAARTSASAADVLLPKIESCQRCHGGEGAHKQVPSSCALCHDYHMDATAPLMVRDNQVRGQRREKAHGSPVADVAGAAPKG